MWTRKVLLSAIVASTFAAVTPSAQSSVDVFINIPPPPARYEVVPEPRVGFVWAPGYWDWRSNRHVWVKGRWERERSGYNYHPHRWVERDGRWSLERGRWENDRDRDGVPNRYDRAPDNPRRQ